MQLVQTDKRTDGQTDGRTTATLRFPLDAASVISLQVTRFVAVGNRLAAAAAV